MKCLSFSGVKKIVFSIEYTYNDVRFSYFTDGWRFYESICLSQRKLFDERGILLKSTTEKGILAKELSVKCIRKRMED